MKIDAVSDLHGHYPELEGGDILILAGDFTAMDSVEEFEIFDEWLSELDFEYKIVVAGNHDSTIQREKYKIKNATYLCDSGVEIKNFKFYGSPWTAQFRGINPHCCAFTMPFGCYTEDHLYDKFVQIPRDTDILITHGPAYGILDRTIDGRRVGSKALYNWLKYVGRPLIHCFGHIHESYGIEEHFCTHNDKMMKSINCSFVNEKYKPVNKHIRIEI